MGWKKEFVSKYLYELRVLNFVETPSSHALNRYSTDVDGPPTESLLSESTSPLCWGSSMEFWLVQDLECCSIRILLSLIFVNLKNTNKGYRSRRLASPIEIIMVKIQRMNKHTFRTISKFIDLIRLCENIRQDLKQIK